MLVESESEYGLDMLHCRPTDIYLIFEFFQVSFKLSFALYFVYILEILYDLF